MTTPKVAMPISESVKTAVGKRTANYSNDYSSFDSIMNKNVQDKRENTGKDVNAVKKDTSYYADSTKNKNSTENAVSEKPNSSLDSSEKNQSVSQKKEDDFSTEEIGTSAGEQGDAVSDEAMAVLSQLEQMILTNVSEQLGMSAEELSSQLEELEMSPLDLLNTEDLKQFVLDLNGADSPIEFLTNEDMAEQFQNLLDTIQEMPVEELGISKDQIADLVQAMPQEKMQPVMEEAVPATSMLQAQNQEETELVMADGQQTDSVEGEEIPVIVTKETAEGNNKLSDHSNSNMQQDTRSQKEEGMAADQNGKPVDLFIQNLSTRQVSNLEHMSQGIDQTHLMKDIVHQIVEQIKIAVKPESTSMEMQLNPEHLGKINLTVVEKNGEMTASFIAQNHAAKEAIESQIQTLKENLNNQGLKVEAVEVTVSEFGFRQDAQTGQGTESQNSNKERSTNRRKIDLSTFDDSQENVTEEEILAANVMRDNGGSIDYTA